MGKVNEAYRNISKHQKDVFEAEPVSLCCEAYPSGELDGDIGYCSNCGRGSGFKILDPNEVVEKLGSCDRCTKTIYSNTNYKYITISEDYDIVFCNDCLDEEYWNFG